MHETTMSLGMCFDIMFKLFILPKGYEVLYHKFWNMRLEILYQFKGVVSLYNTLLIFLSQPSKVLPTTSWPMNRHCVFLLVQSSSRHIFNNSIPQLWQSPMIQLLLWNSTVSSLEHNTPHWNQCIVCLKMGTTRGFMTWHIVQLRFADILTRTNIVIVDALP